MTPLPREAASTSPTSAIGSVGAFRKVVVAGLLLIAIATLVNFLLLSWRHPTLTTASAEVVFASLLTSALLIVTASIATAVVVRPIAEEDNRIGDHDMRIVSLGNEVKGLGQSLEDLNERVQEAAPLISHLPEKVEDLEAEAASLSGLPNRVEDLETKCRELADTVRSLQAENTSAHAWFRRRSRRWTG